MPDADSMRLFGPGVIDDANAKPARGNSVSMASPPHGTHRIAPIACWYRSSYVVFQLIQMQPTMSRRSPRYEQVASLVERQILSWSMKPSDRVPSLRTMSRAAGVSVGTVVQAYLHLERRGLVETRPRSGFYVAARAPAAASPSALAARSRKPRPVAPKVVDTVLAALGRPDLVALNSAVTDPASRLNGRLNGLTRRILREHPELPNVFVPPPGLEALRREIAKRMALTGASVDPDDIVITNGTMEALALSLGVLCKPGDAVLVESPTYFGILQLLEHLGLKVVEVPNHPEHGIDADALEYAVAGGRIAAAVLQSSFNNPTGAVTPDAVKARIVRILAER